MKPIRIVKFSFVLLAYAFCSVALTWPLATRLGSSITYGDAMGQVWMMWSRANGYWVNNTTALLCAPFGLVREYGATQPLYELIFGAAARFFPAVFAYNLVLIAAFPLTAWITYLFLDYLLNDGTAAFIGGLLFGFSPGAVAQGMAGHLSFSINFFFPLFLLALFHHRARRTAVSSVCVGVIYALLTLTCMYWGYFAFFVGMAFLFFDLREDPPFQKKAGSYLAGGLTAAGSLLIALFPVFYYRMTASKDVLEHSGFFRKPGDLLVYSAYPWEYFLPSINHPIFGRWVESFFRMFLHGSNVFEQSIYIGIIPIVFVGWGLVLNQRELMSVRGRRLFIFFCGEGLLMAFISFPRISSLLFYLAPMFRVYARAGIIVAFFLACATAVVVSDLKARVPLFRKAVFVPILVSIFVFDTWSMAPDYFRELKTPDVYAWLESQPGDALVAEYPMMNRDDAAFYRYLYWQRIHKKRLVNGSAPIYKDSWDFYQRVRDLSKPGAIEELRRAGVKFVIVHAGYYAEGPIPYALKRYFSPDAAARCYDGGVAPENPLLQRPVKRFGADSVYELASDKKASAKW